MLVLVSPARLDEALVVLAPSAEYGPDAGVDMPEYGCPCCCCAYGEYASWAICGG